MIISSHDKEKFEVGKTYWTYFFDTTNKGNKIIDYTGLFKATLVKKTPSQYSEGGIHIEFTIEGGKFGKTMQTNIHTYMNGYGLSFCYFSENYDEIVEHHDKEIKYHAKGLSTKDRDAMYSKLIIKGSTDYTKKETKAIEWYNNLSKEDKENVSVLVKLQYTK